MPPCSLSFFKGLPSKKVKIQHLYSTASGAVRTPGPAFSFGRSPSPHTDFRLQPYVAAVCRFNGLYLRNPCKYMNYYLFTDPGGLEGKVSLVG